MEQRLSENIKGVYRRMAHAAMRAGREPDEVTLIAVSKNVSAPVVRGAIEAGLRDFGENRIQEFSAKLLQLFLPAGYSLRWHLIGHLQKNKAKSAVELFDVIHSVDSLELAERINKLAENMGKIQKILIQVKLSDEESKYGILQEEVLNILSATADMKNLHIDGLMTIPPFFDDPEKVRPFFRELREIRDRAGQMGFDLTELSMGMSHDLEVAIEEGATMVRVGTAIFGERKKEEAA
ncbi:MAG TPA: YggS family pyridoxal phosphate-dependent enzyme [Candidatus Sulfobium mesophilum]|nr:YggS family pyridoxal phosphate-dependent enzyme [Candidatus Sulfobium mesophilum]